LRNAEWGLQNKKIRGRVGDARVGARGARPLDEMTGRHAGVFF